MKNLLENLPFSVDAEIFEELLRGAEFRVERIVSRGQATPPDQWYDQTDDEWVVLLTGAARLRLENADQIFELRPGDSLNIAAHQRHRVEWTDPQSPTVWLAIHYRPAGPREPSSSDFA